ncbi:sporulation and spore germination protein [Motilibacter peucedani]|uniref:Sporulation and spore germination protein n=1 Tax=Motilibacter peucedani TaxID=598650 RepID=A0A420XQM8_9ACTN|nr:GerMN domain-containing protein [Motilibacter peucedani]RKS75569.1 sporulation and spore germination protein [Motilibacter peucedani]
MRPCTRVLTGVVVTAVLAGCGVPSAGDVHRVDRQDVPYGLLSGATGSATPSTSPREQELPGVPTVYFVRDDQLVGVPVQQGGTTTARNLGAVVGALSSGPTGQQRAQGLDTALPPALHLAVAEVAGRTATVDLQGQDVAAVGDQGPLAVGQVVLTAASVPGVDRVLLTRQGRPVQAQLADGTLTDRPLAPGDYASLVARHAR